MRITDELRDWFEHAYNYGTGEKMFEKIPHPWFGWKLELERMLDRIDEEYEAQVADAFDTRNSDENLEADGWVKLPVDADGVPIHVGDRLTDGEYTFRVHQMCATFWESSTWWGISNEDGIAWSACDVTHCPAPTVEEVLCEFARRAAGKDAISIRRDIVDDYAARLQLKEVDG